MADILWSFDSVVLAAVAADVEPRVGSAVARVVQPDRDEIVLVLRGQSVQTSLLFSIHPRWARVHLISGAPAGLATPSGFCQLLRARLEGARLGGIVQPDFERTISLEFGTDDGPVTLIAEVMGRHSNLIAVQAETILGALKTVTPRMSSVRQVVPGGQYRPPARERPAPPELSEPALEELLASSTGPVARRLAGQMLGLSPLLAGELVARAGLDPAGRAQSPAQQAAALWPVLTALVDIIMTRRFHPVLYRTNGTPAGFAPFPYTHLTGLTAVPTPTMSTAVAAVAERATVESRFGDDRSALQTAIRAAIEKMTRVETELHKAQAEAAGGEELKQQGDLLFAYGSQIPRGSTEVTLPGFDGTPVTIRLDPALSPAGNARRLFKRLARVRSAQPEVARRLREAGGQRAYLEEALVLVDTATSSDDLRSVRDELIEDKVLTARTRVTPQTQPRGPRRFVTSSGHEVIVGRTNRENDRVTFEMARAGDLWLHARGMPGAHVIIRSDGRRVPDRTIEEAAQIAAYFSRGCGSAKVPVSYTLRKYVKKPRGAKPGLVTISNEKTVVVEPTLPV